MYRRFGCPSCSSPAPALHAGRAGGALNRPDDVPTRCNVRCAIVEDELAASHMCHRRVAVHVGSRGPGDTMYRIPARRRVAVTATVAAWLFVAISGAWGLEIKDLRVPTVVQAGSTDPLTLDCDYVYDDDEKWSIVVKWYRESEQVYQWIANYSDPQALGILSGRLDMDYKASDDPFSKHRALRILKPNINMTGDYKCHVSSNFQDADKTQKMVVYSPAKDMWMNFSKPDPYSVNISCGAEGMYPEPSAEMIIVKGRKKTRNRVHDPTTDVSFKDDGLYKVVLHKKFQDKLLSAETTFECVIAVPDTTYTERRSVEYHPGDEAVEGSNNIHKNVIGNNGSPRSTESSLIGVPTVGVSSATTHWLSHTSLLTSLLVLYHYIWRFVV